MAVSDHRWTRDSVTAFWSAVSQSRLSELDFARINGTRLIELCRPYLSPAMRLLDYGAGDGDLVRALVAAGYSVAGLDLSTRRGLAETAAELQDDPRFLGLCGGGRRERFDGVLLVEVVEHVLDEDLADFFEDVGSRLAPGGLVIATTPNREDLELAGVVCPVCSTRFHRWQHVRAFDRQSLVQFLAPLGLETVALDEVDFSATRLLIAELNRLAGEAEYWKERALERRSAVRDWWGKITGNPPEIPQIVPSNRFCDLGGTLLYVGRRQS